LKIFFQLFLQFSVLFGGLMGVLVGADRGWAEGLRIGAFDGVCYGAIMALVMGAFHRYQAIKLAAGENLGPIQELELDILSPSLQAVFVRVLEAVKQFGVKIEMSDAETGTIHARVRASWQGFGEYIDVRIKHVIDTRYSVSVISRPRFRWTIIDYGKSCQNIRAIAHRLSTG
jgi:hypothetical protein